MPTTVQVELQRRNQSNQVVPWTVNDDGTEPVADAEVRDKLDQLIAVLNKEFTFFQGTPEAVWTIVHNLGRPPDVRVIRSDGTQVFGTVQHIDSNTTQVSFSGAFSGIAYLN